MNVEHIKNGLLAAITDSGVEFATIAPFSTRDLRGESGEIVVIKPAALVVYQGSSFSGRNLPNTLYQDVGGWEVLIATEDLAGGDQASASALAIIDGLRVKLGGLKLEAASGRAIVELAGTELVSFAPGAALYSIVLKDESDFQTSP